MMLRNKCLLLVLCCANVFSSSAQQFKYAAALEEVPVSGFYAIDLLPDLLAHTKTDLTDLRIIDKKNQWVPHLVKTRERPPSTAPLIALPLIQNQLTDSGKNFLVIENKDGETLNNLVLNIKNTLVNRTALLSGSNNQQDWFIIDDQVRLNRSNETGKEQYLQPIWFPPVAYRYFKIIINNDHNDPLLVTGSGYYSPQPGIGATSYHQNPSTIVTQHDSNKITYVRVKQPASYPFNKLSLVVNGPAYYNRVAEIRLGTLGKTVATGQLLARFNIASNLPLSFDVPPAKTTTFYLLIYNGDNPPLRIMEAITHQEKVSILSYLEKGNTYRLVFGDSFAVPANYDLATFKDSIQVVQPLRYGEIFTMTDTATIAGEDRYQNWIWPAIVVAGLLMGFLVYRLSSELPKKNQ